MSQRRRAVASFPSHPTRRWAAWGVLGLGTLSVAALPHKATGDPPAAPVPAEQAAFFEAKIRPVLVESCVPCHNKDSAMGGLRLDTRAMLLKGGETGPAILSGDADKSLLITAVHQTGKLKMPQGGKLTPEQIENLSAWVKMGAPWPDTKGVVEAKPGSEKWRSFWSLQPVKAPAVPAVKTKAWVKNPIDAFVLARLEARNLAPAAPADKRTLLRRVTFDLTGLPPTPGETEAFVADKRPDAYARVVDRLLGSPRYGERWARHWLDVARYADTKGYVFNEDRTYPWAWTYREWVIRSFNEDLPYDRFLTDQLAADLLPEVQNGEDKRPLAALGFLTVGRRFLNSQPDIIDDRIDVTMRGMQGLTVACARCHDHKFDPIPTQDYYSLYSVFASSQENTPPISPKNISEPWATHDAKVKADENAARDAIMAQVNRLRERDKAAKDGKGTALPDEVSKTLAGFREGEFPSDDRLAKLLPAFEDEARTKITGLRTETEALKKAYPPQPDLAMAMTDNPHPFNVHVFKRGNQGNQGDEAPRRFLAAFTKPGTERPLWTNGSGRLDLARAIASKDNPLTARVLVNRVWLHHFGQAIVRTPSDFGKQGERPTNPELLDYLASQFMAQGWSIKKLHRMILLSSAYQQSSDVSPRMMAADPENRLVGRQNRRRLDLEQMRDALLWASGKLDTRNVGGKSVDIWNTSDTPRRSVYGFIERQNLPGIFKTFDFATPDSTNAQRFRTTVPQQGLFLMNSAFAVEQARALADRPDIKSAPDDATRVRRIYLRLFDRLPDSDELETGRAFLARTNGGPAQNAPVWQYGFGGWDDARRAVAFTPLAHYAGDRGWTVGEKFPDDKLGYVVLSAEGGHPGRDQSHAVVRRWTAPRAGWVSVAGTLKHPAPQGDGVHARVVSSRSGVLGEWAAHTGEAKTLVAPVHVEAGETLDFVTDCISNDNSDSFAWAPTIRAVAPPVPANAVALVADKTGTPPVNTLSPGTSWSAKRDFGGPPPAPLPRWGQYAQALLMTNEFMFVD